VALFEGNKIIYSYKGIHLKTNYVYLKIYNKAQNKLHNNINSDLSELINTDIDK